MTRLMWIVIMVASAGVWPALAFTQAPADEPSRSVCFSERNRPECGVFLLADLEILQWGFGSTLSEPALGVGSESQALNSFWAWSAGAMARVEARQAIGAAATYGYNSNGRRLGLEARYRYWPRPRLPMDLSAGVLSLDVQVPRDELGRPPSYVNGRGFTAGASVGLADWVALTARTDMVWTDDERATAVYGGARLATVPGLVLTAAVLAVLALSGG